MEKVRDVSPETLITRILGGIDEKTPAIVPPIHASTTYLRDADGGYSSGRGYTRADNPTYDEPEQMLTKLEGGTNCLLFASGMAAATAVFQALLPGDHVVISRYMYWALRKWLNQFAVSWGLEVEFVDTCQTQVLEAAVRPGKTRLVWIETPANPTWDITDIAAAAAIAHKANARLAVDSTVATPVLTRPLELGADLVVHSASKYLNGHSDVLAGALVTCVADSFWQRIRAWRGTAGSVLGPFEAWLLLRGMRTLFLRVKRNSESAMAVANHFRDHPLLLQVLYPGLSDHPGHEIAARQMSGGFGGMLSLRLRGGVDAAMAAAARMELIKRATSLGGFESLVEHRASIEGPSTPVPEDLLRLSIGLEHPSDLIDDIEQALEHAVPANAPTKMPSQPGPGVADSGAASGADSAAGLAARIESFLWEHVRPMVLDRGGDLIFDGIKEQIVHLRPLGSLGALLPMQRQIESNLRNRFPQVQGVRILAADSTAATDADRGGDAAGADTDAPRAEAIQQLLDEQINPALAAHEGSMHLHGIAGRTVSLRFEGRCQGCAMAEVTLRQGVEIVLKERLRGIGAVCDVTDHQAGADPYYFSQKSGGGI